MVDPGALFADPELAAGYARDRPRVHPALMDRVRAWSGWTRPVHRAVDVGCGAGASTAALAELAVCRIGIDPSVAMIAAARSTVRGCGFAVGTAEALPVPDGSVALLGAAGALDFADLDRARAEAARVLEPGGALVVSDYSFGRPERNPDFPDLLLARWPRPPVRRVTRESFVTAGPFAAASDQRFVVSVAMRDAAYLAYVMTDTSVAAAVRHGVGAAEVREWCVDALGGGWDGLAPVEFDCSVLILTSP
jgi:SAM-dependent methyltransferase